MHLGGIEGGGIWSHGGLEGTPIAENGFLYVTDGWGSVYKIDAHGGRGVMVWKMDPKTDRDWAGAVACCGVDNRGVALWGDLVISHTLDGRLIATNKETGQVAWQRTVADPDKGEVITGAPLIVKNMAITGVAGAEYGIRGWIAATDLATQKEVWRTHTIPGKGEPGSDTWKDSNNAAAAGGGSTWVTGTYDPATDTIIWGVGNPGPDWDNAYRPGDNLYTDSSLALDATTGKIKWHYQHTPNDPYDYDSVAENVLVDIPGPSGPRKLALEADRNGFAYAIDRTTGKFVWGLPFVKKVTWTKGLDAETGKPIEYDPNKPVQNYVASVTPSRDQYGNRHLPRQHGRQELAADGLQSGSEALVHPGDRELQSHQGRGRDAGQAETSRVLDRRWPEPAIQDHRQRHGDRRDHRQDRRQTGNAVPESGRDACDSRPRLHRPAIRRSDGA